MKLTQFLNSERICGLEISQPFLSSLPLPTGCFEQFLLPLNRSYQLLYTSLGLLTWVLYIYTWQWFRVLLNAHTLYNSTSLLWAEISFRNCSSMCMFSSCPWQSAKSILHQLTLGRADSHGNTGTDLTDKSSQLFKSLFNVWFALPSGFQ